MNTITAQALKPLLTEDAEIAFLDIREHGQYGEGHPFFCVHLPYSLLEFRIPILVPCKSTLIVLMDHADGVSEKAASILAKDGYSNIRILENGVKGWKDAGYGLFKGVNVPSKTFGELVEHNFGTPSISAKQLHEKLQANHDLVVLDGRSPKEFNKMSIPTARSCPNAELAYRLPCIVTNDATPVVINCAGRTRSIIGAETLRQAGLKNPVYALRNGTQGWRLAGFDLDNGKDPGTLCELSAEDRTRSAQVADEILVKHSIEKISMSTLEQWQGEVDRTTYILDVRTAEEFRAGHLKGARHAPGGQLVQATDEYVGVRNARIVLCDDTGLRCATTAMWLKMMGHQVFVLDIDVSNAEAGEMVNKGQNLQADSSAVSIEEAFQHHMSGALLLDASRGMDYRANHINGAQWVTRSRLDQLDISPDVHIIVTGNSTALIAGVFKDLRDKGHKRLDWFAGSPGDWKAVGFELEETPDHPSEKDCIDYLFFVHDRHDGNLEAARNYLSWELGLLDQLDAQERSYIESNLNNATQSVADPVRVL